MSGVTQRAWRVDGFHGTRHSDFTLTSAVNDNNNMAFNGLGWSGPNSQQPESFAFFACWHSSLRPLPFKDSSQ